MGKAYHAHVCKNDMMRPIIFAIILVYFAIILTIEIYELLYTKCISIL